jgi:hypothetical protein
MQAVNVKSILFDSVIKLKTIKRNPFTGTRNPQKKDSFYSIFCCVLNVTNF